MSTSTNFLRRSNCPIACTLDLLGDKWTLLVLRDLFLGKHFFDEFLNSEELIASNILTDRLTKLVTLGYVAKKKEKDDGRRVKYILTKKAIVFGELISNVADWGLKQFSQTKLIKPIRALEFAGV